MLITALQIVFLVVLAVSVGFQFGWPIGGMVAGVSGFCSAVWVERHPSGGA